MKASATVRLLIFVAVVLGVTAIVNQLIPTRTAFNAKPVSRLRLTQPDLIFIGDSILGSAVDPRVFEEQLGSPARVELLWNGGAASASWYLLLKNYVVASGVRPRLCCIFFRDRMLTDPTFRTTPTYRHFLESVMRGDEPLVRQIVGTDRDSGRLEQAINRVYPLNTRRHVQQERISRIAFRTAAMSSRGSGGLRRRVNEIFDVARLRDEVMPESADVTGEAAAPFDPDPAKSFLPHIVELAANSGIPLCFVREKRHPNAAGQVIESDELARYAADLRTWLESRGCAFVDMTNDREPTGDMYLKENDDHMAPRAKRRSSGIYAEKLKPLLQR